MIPVVTAFLAALGGVVGSFATSLGLRLAEGRPWVSGRSSCEGCERPLRYSETIPVVSFVRAGGRCVSCGGRIARVHLVGECLGVALLPFAVLTLGPLEGGLVFALAMTLLAASVTDYVKQELPDELTALAAVIGLALAWLINPLNAGVGILAAGATFIVLQGLRFLAARRSGEPGLGMGDVKLYCAAALWLGAALPWAAALASGLGLAAMLIKRPASKRIAFGPYIALSTVIVGVSVRELGWL